MMVFTSELHYLGELYDKLSHELNPACPAGEANSPESIAEALLRNQDLVFRIEQLNQRVAQLAAEWSVLRNRMDTPLRKEVEALAGTVRRKAEELLKSCRERACRLDASLQRITRKLGEIRRGEQYLESVRPPSTNYPKFVDSLG
jgi:hypothetical protein